MNKDANRLQVIENIKKAIENKTFNVKVEENDHLDT